MTNREAQNILLGVDREQPAPSTCRHLAFEAFVTVNRLEDTGRFSADVMIRCRDCGSPFRFLGLPSGVLTATPTVSIDGLELRAPIEPEGDTQVFSGARYEMAPRPMRH